MLSKSISSRPTSVPFCSLQLRPSQQLVKKEVSLFLSRKRKITKFLCLYKICPRKKKNILCPLEDLFLSLFFSFLVVSSLLDKKNEWIISRPNRLFSSFFRCETSEAVGKHQKERKKEQSCESILSIKYFRANGFYCSWQTVGKVNWHEKCFLALLPWEEEEEKQALLCLGQTCQRQIPQTFPGENCERKKSGTESQWQ